MLFRSADMALLMVDARTGITPADAEFARIVRVSQKPVILVANKVEGKAAEAGLYDAYSLGLGEPVSISAEHGLGLADLHNAIAEHVPYRGKPKAEDDDGEDEDVPPLSEEVSPDEKPHGPLRLAIVGKPNVGKSTLLNRLVGEERVITGPEPGLTRDAIAVQWEYEGQAVQLVDTAGMRRAMRVTGDLEKLSSRDSRRAIGLSEVCVLVIDATEPMGRTDLSAASFAIDEGRCVVVALNKIDAVEDPSAVKIGRAHV